MAEQNRNFAEAGLLIETGESGRRFAEAGLMVETGESGRRFAEVGLMIEVAIPVTVEAFWCQII